MVLTRTPPAPRLLLVNAGEGPARRPVRREPAAVRHQGEGRRHRSCRPRRRERPPGARRRRPQAPRPASPAARSRRRRALPRASRAASLACPRAAPMTCAPCAASSCTSRNAHASGRAEDQDPVTGPGGDRARGERSTLEDSAALVVPSCRNGGGGEAGRPRRVRRQCSQRRPRRAGGSRPSRRGPAGVRGHRLGRAIAGSPSRRPPPPSRPPRCLARRAAGMGKIARAGAPERIIVSTNRTSHAEAAIRTCSGPGTGSGRSVARSHVRGTEGAYLDGAHDGQATSVLSGGAVMSRAAKPGTGRGRR